MKKIIYKNQNLVLTLAILLITIGLFMAYMYWGIEPQETISGTFCGLGAGILILYFSIKEG